MKMPMLLGKTLLQTIAISDSDPPVVPGILPSGDDDDLMNVVEINGNSFTAGVPFLLPSGAKLTMNTDGTFVYNPNGAFEDLGTNERAIDSFTYTINDDRGDGTAVAQDTATVRIEINGVNDAPTANDDLAYTVTESGTLVTDATTGVLGNDTDPDGDPLVAKNIDTTGVEGTITFDADSGNDGGLLATFVDLDNNFGGNANDIRVGAKPVWMMQAPTAGEDFLLQAFHRLGMVPTVGDTIVPELDFPNTTTANPYATRWERKFDRAGVKFRPGRRAFRGPDRDHNSRDLYLCRQWR